jgi:hypothetical protein
MMANGGGVGLLFCCGHRNKDAISHSVELDMISAGKS